MAPRVESRPEGRRLVAAAAAVLLALLAILGVGLWLIAGSRGEGPSRFDGDEWAKGGLASAPAVPPLEPARAMESHRAEADAEQESSRTFRLHGWVRTAAGARISGARVVVLPPHFADPGSSARAPIASQVSGPDGGFRFERIPARSCYVLAECAEGAPGLAWLDQRSLLPLPNALGPLVLTVEPGVTLEGSVVPAPPANTKITVCYELLRRTATGDEDWWDGGAAAGLAVPVDAGGRFTIPRVPKPSSGMLHVVARGDGFLGTVALAADPWPPPPVEVPLRPTLTLLGEVRGEGGGALADARVALGRSRCGTDGSGRFALPIDPRDVGAFDLVVAAPGHAWRCIPEDLREPLSAPRIVQLDRGVAIEGLVRTEGGAPAEGAIVTSEGRRFLGGQRAEPDFARAQIATRLHRLETARTTADAAGRFRLDHLPAESLLVAPRWRGLPGDSQPHESRPPESGLVLDLAAPPRGFATLEGRAIERSTREPVPNIRAVLATDWGVLRALVAGDGSFRFDRVPAGQWRLRVVPGPGSSFTPGERTVRLGPQEDARDLIVELAGRGRATVRVKGASGEAADGLALALAPIEGEALSEPPLDAAAVVQGIATFEDLPAGTYGVFVAGGALAPAAPVHVRVEPGRTAEATLGLVPGRPLLLVAQSRDGEATLAPFGVRIRDAAGSLVFNRRPSATRSLSGAGITVVLAPGAYAVSIDRGDQTISERRVAVSSEDGGFALFEIASDERR